MEGRGERGGETEGVERLVFGRGTLMGRTEGVTEGINDLRAGLLRLGVRSGGEMESVAGRLGVRRGVFGGESAENRLVVMTGLGGERLGATDGLGLGEDGRLGLVLGEVLRLGLALDLGLVTDGPVVAVPRAFIEPTILKYSVIVALPSFLPKFLLAQSKPSLEKALI